MSQTHPSETLQRPMVFGQLASLPVLLPDQIRALGETVRWHTRATLRSQTVADHSAKVALLALYLWPSPQPEVRLAILQWALMHDAHEPQFGDLPYPVKQAMRQKGLDLDLESQGIFFQPLENPVNYLPTDVLAVVDVADILEAAVFSAKWLPEIAAEIRHDAERVARARLSEPSQAGMLTRALGILEDLR